MFSSNLKADDVLYCKSEVAAGLINKSGIWEEANFELKRFTIKFNDDYSLLKSEDLSYFKLVCQKSYPKQLPNRVFCVNIEGSFDTFQYDILSKRFSHASASAGGYAHDGQDTEAIYGLAGVSW